MRGADGQGGNWQKAFGSADDFETANGAAVLDFWQATDKARELARGGDDKSSGTRPATVGEAIDSYRLTFSAARGGHKSNAKSLMFNVPATMKAKTVSLLTAKELAVAQCHGQARRQSRNSQPRSQSFKACLNLAAADDPRISDQAWRTGLKKLPDDEDHARNVILSDDLVRAVIAACYADSEEFGRFFEALAATGAKKANRCG